MRAPNNKRARGRANRRPPNPNRSFESNGPDGKIRGNANQVYDKYSQLARDAAAAGDLVAAEGFWQHAEHYYRIMMSMQQNRQQQNQSGNDGQDQNDQNDRSGNDQNDRSGDDQNDRDQDDQGQPQSRSSGRGRKGGNRNEDRGEDRNDDGNDGGDQGGESDTAGLERAVRGTRTRKPRRSRDDEDQGGDEDRAAATEDAAD